MNASEVHALQLLRSLGAMRTQLNFVICLYVAVHKKQWVKRDYDKLRLRGRKALARRERWLRAHPLCVSCEARGALAEATELDHITPLSRGGAEDDSNLQGLCHTCHEAKSAAEMGRAIRQTIGIDGFPVNSSN